MLSEGLRNIISGTLPSNHLTLGRNCCICTECSNVLSVKMAKLMLA